MCEIIKYIVYISNLQSTLTLVAAAAAAAAAAVVVVVEL